MSRLLFIHGRSQGGNNPAQLKSDWLDALNKGMKKADLILPSDLEIDFPFYGDKLDEFVRQFELPVDPAFVPKGSPVFDDYAAFRAEIAEEMRRRADIPIAEVQKEMGPAPAEKGPQNWQWVQAIIRLLDRRWVGASQATIEVFLRDVYLYCRRDVVKTTIDKIVATMLKPETSVVVGHSLGSIVGYNVLNSNANKRLLYVTVGSPLAIRALRKTLEPLANPTKEWSNAYDTRDVVALYPLDAVNFDVDPSISNNGTVQNWTDNRHGIAGYLDDANVARIVHSGLVS